MSCVTVHRIRCPRRRVRRRAMTLIELIVSLTILSILTVATGSAILLATRAAEMSAASTAGASSVQHVAGRIAADLQLAMVFTERTDTAATFTVPDRDGDDAPETIRYAWSGVAGDPLTFEYNGGSPVTIADDVRQFSLSYLLRTEGAAPTPEEQESDEMELISHDDAPGGQFKDRDIKNTWAAAQYFKPTLPTNATSWKITRVLFRGRTGGAGDGQSLVVQITGADVARKPSAEVLEAVQVPESSLGGSYSWEEVAFGSTSGLDPSQGYCLVIKGLSPGLCGKVEFEQDGSPMTPDAHWLTSNDGGSTWSDPVDNKDMRFFIYGTVTTQGAPQWP